MSRTSEWSGSRTSLSTSLFSRDIFPARPVMPGVLIVEAMAQTAGVMMLANLPDRETKLVFFTGIDGAKFRRPVVPGDQLRLELTVLRLRPRYISLRGEAYVDGQLVAEAEISSSLVDRSHRRAQRSDQQRRLLARRARCRSAREVSIHPTAIISPKAELGRNVAVGPYSIIGDDVILHDDVQVASHCVIEGPSEFGSGSVFFPFVSAGQAPQDLKYKGERSWLRAGERNTFREFITLQRGTEGGGNLTEIGSDNLFMAQVPHRARLPYRRPCHLRQWSHARRSCDRRRLRDALALTRACISSAGWASTLLSGATRL